MRTLKLILSGWQSVALVVSFMLFFNMEVSGKGKITKKCSCLYAIYLSGRGCYLSKQSFKAG